MAKAKPGLSSCITVLPHGTKKGKKMGFTILKDREYQIIDLIYNENLSAQIGIHYKHS